MKRTKIVYLGIVAVFIIGLVVWVGAYRTAPAFAEESKNTEKTNPVGAVSYTHLRAHET